jgi:hypothetical protein
MSDISPALVMRTDYSDQTRKGETQITRDRQPDAPSTVVVQPRSPAPTTGTLPGADSPGEASHAPRSVWTPRPIPGSSPPDRLPPAPAHTRHRSAWPAATPPISPHHRPGATKGHHHLEAARPDPAFFDKHPHEHPRTKKLGLRFDLPLSTTASQPRVRQCPRRPQAKSRSSPRWSATTPPPSISPRRQPPNSLGRCGYPQSPDHLRPEAMKRRPRPRFTRESARRRASITPRPLAHRSGSDPSLRTRDVTDGPSAAH